MFGTYTRTVSESLGFDSQRSNNFFLLAKASKYAIHYSLLLPLPFMRDAADMNGANLIFKKNHQTGKHKRNKM